MGLSGGTGSENYCRQDEAQLDPTVTLRHSFTTPTVAIARSASTAATPVSVISTDFFAFDDASNHYGLRTYQPDAKAVE